MKPESVSVGGAEDAARHQLMDNSPIQIEMMVNVVGLGIGVGVVVGVGESIDRVSSQKLGNSQLVRTDERTMAMSEGCGLSDGERFDSAE